jgi:hypothetical protein
MATATGWSWSVRAAHRAESSDRSTTDDSYRQYGSESYLSAPWSRETSGSLFAWSGDYAKLEVAIYVGACLTTVDTVAIRSTRAAAKANTALNTSAVTAMASGELVSPTADFAVSR